MNSSSSWTICRPSVHHVVTNLLAFDLVEFEGEGLGNVCLFPIGHAVPELGRLAEVVGEAVTADTDLRTVDLFGVGDEGVGSLR